MRGRRSIRLPGHDYAGHGAYFITICAQERRPWFGAVRGGAVDLTDAGRMVWAEWLALPARLGGVALDAFVAMPDHIHGVVRLGGGVGLGLVVQTLKSRTTLAYTAGVRGQGWPAFAGRLWQRNYYERVVRDQEALDAIREYIRQNPMRWWLRHGKPNNTP